MKYFIFTQSIAYQHTNMTNKASSVDEYIASIEDMDKKKAIIQLREICLKCLPEGFEEGIGYGMISYHVPHSLYPSGYHCDPKLPLPFINLAAQKNFVAIYHMGIYADTNLLEWFVAEHAVQSPLKLDMGKSCIRYKKPQAIPLDLIEALMTKMSPSDWIERYEAAFKKNH